MAGASLTIWLTFSASVMRETRSRARCSAVRVGSRRSAGGDGVGRLQAGARTATRTRTRTRTGRAARIELTLFQRDDRLRVDLLLAADEPRRQHVVLVPLHEAEVLRDRD